MNNLKGNEYNDYKNPAIWIITLFSLLVGAAVGYVFISIVDLGLLAAGAIPATAILVSWVIMWEYYKRTEGFKKRYGYK